MSLTASQASPSRAGAPVSFPPLAVAAGPVLVLLQIGDPGLGDRVDLLALFGGGSHQVLVFQGLQGGVDGARAGAVEAARTLLHLADDVVAMPGLVLQQVEDGEPDAASLEEAPRRA